MKRTKPQPIDDLRASLQREFINRRERNSSYSLRAFAKFLEIDQSYLSKFLRGQKTMSAATAEVIALKLGLETRVSKSVGKGSAYLKLIDDEFHAISEWYHFAILELIKTSGFKSDPVFIAKRLGIHIEQARTAIERLKRIGLVRVESKRLRLSSQNNTWTNTESTSAARLLLQKKILSQSLDALENIPFEAREHGSLTVAVSR